MTAPIAVAATSDDQLPEVVEAAETVLADSCSVISVERMGFTFVQLPDGRAWISWHGQGS